MPEPRETARPGRRPFTIDDLWAMKRVGAPRPLGDGNLVVPVTTYDMEKNRGRTRLWVVAGDGSFAPRPLTSEEASSEQPDVSPDRRRLAFIRKKEGEKAQLHVMPLDGGEAEKLTDFPLGVFDPKWFSDGRHVAFVAPVVLSASGTAVGSMPEAAAVGLAPAPAEQTPVPAAPAPPEPETIARTRRIVQAREAEPVKVRVTEDRVFRYWDKWLTTGEVPHLFVIDLDTKRVVDVTPDSTGWFEFMDPVGQYDIAPDGAEIAFSANASRPPHHVMNWDVFVVPLSFDKSGAVTAGPVRSITAQNPADDVRPRYSPDGRFIYYGFQRDPFFYADKVRLARFDRTSGGTEVLTESWDRSFSGWELAPDGRTIFGMAENLARVALYALPLAAAGSPPAEPKLLLPGGTISGLRVSREDGRLWFNYQDMSRPPEVATCAADGSGFTIVSHFNDAILTSVEMGSVEEMTFPGADGRPVQMFVLYPPGHDRSRKWPLVQMIHGGPHGITGDQFHWRWNAQLFAAPGYVVAMPNFHGSTSFGQAFAASIQGAHGDKPFTDVMASTDFLLQHDPSIDSKRMAAIGGSYGGYLVTWIAGHTDRFACLVNHAGVYDLLSQYASDVSQGRHVAYGGEPWDGIENIDRWSPNRFAAGFKSPMLVIHGDNDYRVPHTQGLEVYGVYKAKGLEARLVSYPDENHWILSARNSRFWYGEVLGWLARHLKEGR